MNSFKQIYDIKYIEYQAACLNTSLQTVRPRILHTEIHPMFALKETKIFSELHMIPAGKKKTSKTIRDQSARRNMIVFTRLMNPTMYNMHDIA